MALKSRTTLKGYFETNDRPTQSQYADLIDSIPNFVDDNPTFGFNWKGDWDNSIRYVKYDSVYYDVTGSSYVCIKAHDAYVVPTDTTYWEKISDKGDTGEQGIQGDDGVVQAVVAGTGISVDSTDPANPVVTNTLDISGKEDKSNKETSALDTSTTKYPCNNVVKSAVDAKISASSTDTLTNKRITPRVSSETSSATPTINTDNVDCHSITALATAITSMTTNLSGTPTNFQKLIIRIKDNGTARAITWGASFEAKGVALPTTTVISKVLTVGFIYDTVTSKWGCVASAQEA